MTWGIYIHVPFCLRKCPYCDFYSTDDLSGLPSYTDALIREMAMRTESVPGAVFDTVYLGGGTPSVINPSVTEQILQSAHRYFYILPDAEITMETNPGTITEESLAGYKAAGINRLNIGVQSFNDDNLAFLDRIHSAGQAAEALHAAKRAGFDNIGLDLIYGLPGQNKKSWQKDLAAAAAFSPSHISCYMLTFEPGTKMAADKEAGRLEPLSEDRVSAMFIQASKFLSGRGYEHYEISNFAASREYRSCHNRKYWLNAPYIGLGPAAHSYVEPERSWNFRSVEDYIEGVADNRLPTEGSEHLTSSQMMIEAIYLGLRQAEGIDIFGFEKRFGVDFENMFRPATAPLVRSGQMEIDGEGCRLTRQGMLYLDTIVNRMLVVSGCTFA